MLSIVENYLTYFKKLGLLSNSSPPLVSQAGYRPGADYETALSKLKRVYVKSPNAIFARYALATRKQNPEESLQTFLNELLVLSKACNFQDVTAEQGATRF